MVLVPVPCANPKCLDSCEGTEQPISDYQSLIWSEGPSRRRESQQHCLSLVGIWTALLYVNQVNLTSWWQMCNIRQLRSSNDELRNSSQRKAAFAGIRSSWILFDDSFSGALKKHKHKEFGQKPPPSQTPPPKRPLTPQILYVGASFPFRIQAKGLHKEFWGAGSWGPQNSLCWIFSGAFLHLIRHRIWPGEGSTAQWKWSPPCPGSLKALLFPPLWNKVQNKGMQRVRARYGAELPPFISIVRYPGRPVILGKDWSWHRTINLVKFWKRGKRPPPPRQESASGL